MPLPKDKDYTIDSVSIPRRYHRTLLGEKSIFIHDIERKTNCTVRFPNKESASDSVTIFGPESQVHIAVAMLLDHVPFEADLHVPPNPDLTRLVSSTEFVLFTERMKRDHQIAISPSPRFGQGDEAIFKFRCQRSSIDFLSTVHDSLVEFLAEHNIQVYPSNAQKRVDSFADAFSHFDSKLLSTSTKTEGTEGSQSTRPVRPPTNVKALFDGSGPTSANAFDPPLTFPPLGFNVPDYWQPGAVVSSPQSTQAASDVSKRGSDSTLEEKVRSSSAAVHHSSGHVPGHSHALSHSHAHPSRAVGARTQSLDITQLNFARALGGPSANSFAPLPTSPTTNSSAAAAGSNNPPPNTATGTFFPQAGQQGRYPSSVEGVTQGELMVL
jgi:hypothetical protein